jgi:hypothetical protein
VSEQEEIDEADTLMSDAPIESGDQLDEDPWDARIEALERVLGPCGDRVFHSVIPLFLGGSADVVTFSQGRIPGVVYVSADLTGFDDSKEYELAVITRREEAWAAPLISNLAAYAANTADLLGGPGSRLKAIVVTRLPAQAGEFSFGGRTFELHVLVGITTAELKYRMEHGTEALLRLLEAQRVLPWTDTQRAGVI